MCSTSVKPAAAKRGRPVKGMGRVAPDLTDRTVRLFYEGLDTPRSLACYLLYKYGEHEQLVRLQCHPGDYVKTCKYYASVCNFRDDYAATCFLSKAVFLKTGIDLEGVALEGFRANEVRCRQTNTRFEKHAYMSANHPTTYFLHEEARRRERWIVQLQRKIMQILGGDFPLDEWFDACNWGPGATASMKGDDTGPERKFHCESGITHEFRLLLERALPVLSPSWCLEIGVAIPGFYSPLADGTAGLRTVRGSRVSTVPKNAKTHRVTAAEPGMNVFFQLGIGKLIARRLLRYGIDLTDQSRNQRLAHYASRANHLATVDFSSASDCIATVPVQELFALVPDWLHAMEVTRSKFSVLPQKPHEKDGVEEWVKLEKFSSMGNGFTFPLQSLIFFACALVACEGSQCSTEYVSVFGDDVILPSAAYEDFSLMCEFLGFVVNRDKTFVSGEFRESCGAHYYRGVDVKPLYLKERLSDVQSAYRLGNGVRDFASRGFPFGRDGRFRHLWVALFTAVPEGERFLIPDGYGDRIGFRVDFDEKCPTTRIKNRWDPSAGRRRAGGQVEGYWFKCIVETSVTYRASHGGVLLARIGKHWKPSALKWDEGDSKGWSGEWHELSPDGGEPDNRAYNNNCTFRRKTKLRKDWIFARSWPTRGPWM